MAGSTFCAPPARASLPALEHPVWLCEPGLQGNPCNQDLYGNQQSPSSSGGFTGLYDLGSAPLDATVVNGDGSTSREPYAPPASPPIDCFYVYPTVDLLSNPLLRIGSNPPKPQYTEKFVTFDQVARLANHCRLFVPEYRGASLLEVAASSLGIPADVSTGIMDVEQAWEEYWEHGNVDPVTHKHRGFVILGHSQGAGDAIALIKSKIETNPVEREHLVAAYLLGGNVSVPKEPANGGGLDGGGTADKASTFASLPACRRPSPEAPVPTGCVVGYSSYDEPSGQAPSDTAWMGRNTDAKGSDANHQILCVDPSALLTGDPATTTETLDPYMPANGIFGASPAVPLSTLGELIAGYAIPNYATGFAHYPEGVHGRCEFAEDAAGNASWLQVEGPEGMLKPSAESSIAGLHLLDFNVDQGAIDTLIGAQSAVWLEASD